MRNKSNNGRASSEGDGPESLPELFDFIATNDVPGFDSIRKSEDLRSPSLGGLASPQTLHLGSVGRQPYPHIGEFRNARKVSFRENYDHSPSIQASQPTTPNPSSPSPMSFSQPMLTGGPSEVGISPKSSIPASLPPRNQKSNKLKDKRYDSFKTWSGKLERQLTMRGKRQPASDEADSYPKPDKESMPAQRYFDALKGPELDTLRGSEEILLPEDNQWPFLLRFPISSFGICLGVGSQSVMWKALATTASVKFLRVSLNVNLFLWCISIFLLATISIIYTLKVIFYFEAVRREYYHPIRINFFFAPWIAFLFIAIGLPPSVSHQLQVWLWYPLMAPIFFLELKIYGQWMSGGQRRLSKVANPSNHLSIVGNFVGALLGASLGLKEGPLFFFAVGLAHYMVLFVTLYQRLPTNETLPKELHPVFFLFVSGPSVASMAWANIQGSFDYGSRICYFISLFLYFSLAVRINFFCGFRFSIAWWAYTFPMTGAAIATIRYSNVVTNIVTKFLAVALSAIATLTVATLLVTTIIYAFVLRDLFPNDMAIAIKDNGTPNSSQRLYQSKYRNLDNIEEDYIKFYNADRRDTEVGDIIPPHPNN